MIRLQLLNVQRVVDSEAKAEVLRSQGYVNVEESEGVDNLIDDMTVPDLKTYAKEKGIDLGEATKKEDILFKIQEAEGGE